MKFKNNGSLMILIAVLLWSLVGLIIKSVDADFVWIMTIRSLSAGVFLSPYIFKEKIYPLKHVVMAGVFMAAFLLSVTLTTQLANSAMAVTMQYTAPMYLIAYKFYTDKRIDKEKLAVLMLILIGIVFIVINSLQDANSISIFTGLIVGITFVFYSYSLQGITEGNPLGIVAAVNIITFLCCVLMLIIRPTAPPTNPSDIIMLVLSGIFISGISYVFYGLGLRMISIDKAMMICLLEPILNPIWVYVGTGDVPTVLTLIGVGFILSGAVVNIIAGRNDVKSAE